MSHDDAVALVQHLVDAFNKRLSEGSFAIYVEEIERLPGAATALALERIIRSKKYFPTIAEVRHEMAAVRREAGADTDAAQASPRMELLVQWRSRLEDPLVSPETKADAKERVSHEYPPVLHDEWDCAREIADDRHTRWCEELRRQGKPAARPRPPATYPTPPPPSYPLPGPPLPGTPAHLLRRGEDRDRIRELVEGVLQRLAVGNPKESRP